MADVDEDGLRQVATDWFHRLRSDVVTDSEREEFEQWLGLSPLHAVIYREVADVWEELGQFERELRDQYALPDRSRRALADEPQRRGIRLPWSSRPRLWALAAMSTAVVAVVVTLGLRGDPAGVLATGRGEQLTTRLEDGSVVRMNSRTRMVVDYSAARRTIRLEDGDAIFEVAHNPERPFIVIAGATSIRAIGTQFNVSRRDHAGAVTVVEGTVQVTAPGTTTATASSVRLTGGHRASFSDSSGMSAVVEVDPRDATAWQQRKLVFDGAPLEEIVRELNRFSGTVLVIGDEELKTVRLSGTFDAENVDTLVESLRWLQNLKTIRIGRYMTVLYLADSR